MFHVLVNKKLMFHVRTMINFQARATHICLDCGFIYTLQKPFDEQVTNQSRSNLILAIYILRVLDQSVNYINE